MTACVMRAAVAAAVAAIVAPRADALARTAKARSGAGPMKEKETVCISLAAYEEPSFIDALLANINGFMELETKVALHLNVLSNYTDDELSRWGGDVNLHVRKSGYDVSLWESDRVAVTTSLVNSTGVKAVREMITPTVAGQRVEVHALWGSLLAAHVINARTMEEKWPGQCAYFLMQASNMMWVKKGAEDVVRENQYSRIVAQTGPWATNGDHPFTAELATSANLYGWEAHEGSFFPMKDVIGFYKMLDRHLAATHMDLETSLVNFHSYFEESWLPTYMLNFGSRYDREKEREYPPAMCQRLIHAGVPKDEDHVTPEEVDAVIAGEWFYAVKRVKRDVEDSVTQYIMSLAK